MRDVTCVDQRQPPDPEQRPEPLLIPRLPADHDMNRQHRPVFGFHWRGGTANDVDSGGTDGPASGAT